MMWIVAEVIAGRRPGQAETREIRPGDLVHVKAIEANSEISRYRFRPMDVYQPPDFVFRETALESVVLLQHLIHFVPKTRPWSSSENAEPPEKR